MTVEGNHDCDIERLICGINTNQITSLLGVKDLDKFGYCLAKDLHY